jgi:hypothetical protein
MVTGPALRLRGRGNRPRVGQVGPWDRDPLVELMLAYRTSMAVDEALAQSVWAARRAGRSWSEIARAMGLPAALSSWEDVSTGLAAQRRIVWERAGRGE